MTVPVTKRDRAVIRPLPERLINKIAAGEVVERPAAVVKELVENSLDAGSTKIDIVIEKSGSRLIKIVDNGIGIPEDQIEIAFSRHATSKISGLADLERLISYGFRGEALPSIASVSRTRMVSRTPESEHGIEIVIEGGVVQSRKPVAAPLGTTIEIENLFFNTPARRKFMKAESTEARYLSRIAMAMALVRFDVAFSYFLNGRTIFSSKAGSLSDRTADLLGYGQKMVTVEGASPLIRVTGYIGKPDQAQNNRWGHFIFINGRYIHSISLTHALVAGYGELLPKGLYPVGAIILTVDPAEVDVNVHPTKTEVRLSHEREIHEAVVHAVRHALRQDGIIPIFKPQNAQANPTDSGGVTPEALFPPQSNQQTWIPGVMQRGSLNPQMLHELYRSPDATIHDESTIDLQTGEILGPSRATDTVQPDQNTIQPSGPSAGIRLVGRFLDLYLLLQAGDDLYIVDQHTAHERVLYEETLRRLDQQKCVSQQLLLPVQVELDPEKFAVFAESEEMLNQSGFTVKHFGGRMINIEAVPVILSRKGPESVMRKIIDDISSLKSSGHDLKKAMAQSMACRAAVMAGDRISDDEAVGLLEQLLRCENKYSCPHGRPTFVCVSRTELDRQFGRC